MSFPIAKAVETNDLGETEYMCLINNSKFSEKLTYIMSVSLNTDLDVVSSINPTSDTNIAVIGNLPLLTPILQYPVI